MSASVTKFGLGPRELEDARRDAAEEDLAAALPIGFVIGSKYTIKRVLGSGGDGAVYEGEHTEIGHLVAIKVAHRARADHEDIMERFRREARICGSLRHPHVGQIYDVGKLEDGSPYMVMELQEGRSLADVLDETQLPVAAVIDITRQLLAGLIAAHEIGVIHRDVKPDNVMLVRDRSGDVVVKLVDFGISKSVVPDRDTSVTGDGIIVGSPDYMPPEQLRGDAVDVRTDIYAVGVLMYESLTRELPFDAPTVPDLVASILRDAFKPPSAWRPDCPPELERIIQKAMSREPAQRYQTADHLSRALAELQTVVRPVTAPHLVLLSASLSNPPVAALRTRHTRTIDTRTLQHIAVQNAAPAAVVAAEPTRRRRPRLPVRNAAIALATLGTLLLMGGVLSLRRNRDAAAHVSVRAPQAAPVAPRAAPVAPPSAAAQAHAAIAVPPPAPSTELHLPARSREPAAQPLARRSRPAEPDPEAQAVLLKEASTAFVHGNVSQAHALYKQIVARAPRHADAWRGLGMTSARMDQRAEAARAFQRYLQLRPNAADSERIRQQLAKVQ